MVAGQRKSGEKGSEAYFLHCQSGSGSVVRTVGCWMLTGISSSLLTMPHSQLSSSSCPEPCLATHSEARAWGGMWEERGAAVLP